MVAEQTENKRGSECLEVVQSWSLLAPWSLSVLQLSFSSELLLLMRCRILKAVEMLMPYWKTNLHFIPNTVI